MPKSLASLRETAYKIPRGSVTIRLTCGHSAIFLPPVPQPGTDAFCRQCDSWRRRKREPRTTQGGSAGHHDGRLTDCMHTTTPEG